MINEMLRAYVIQLLRRGSYKWKPRDLALKNARISRGVYACAHCKNHMSRKELNIDHIVPVIPLSGTTDFNVIIERMYCSSSGFQILCKPCHKVKTDKENALRKDMRLKAQL